MLKKNLLVGLVIIFIIVSSFISMCYATNDVSKDDLNNALQRYVSSDINEKKYNITVLDDVITIANSDSSYNINYNLTNNPTFTFEVPIKKGISYADFMKKIGSLDIPIICCYAVANNQGVDFEKIKGYYFQRYLEDTFGDTSDNEDSYKIVNDINASIKKEKNDKIIYASEIGERVIEYVNATYGNKKIKTDFYNGINSYEWTVETKDVTNESCKLLSTVKVNLDADFWQLNSSLDSKISKYNADYNIKLKVGQICEVVSTKEISGYALMGDNCIRISSSENKLTATQTGKNNGYIFVDEEEKSIYITVEENTGNDNLDIITLDLDEGFNSKPDNDSDKTDKIQNNIVNNNENNKYESNNGNSEKLRYVLIVIFIILLIILGIGIKNIKDNN